MLTYKNSLKYLDSFTNYEKVRNYEYNEIYFNLNRTKKILSDFSNPQGNFRVIHIAGTKGKGSTAVMLSYILASAGYKIGLYTSPHLVDFKERIKIIQKKNNKIVEKKISYKEVIELVEKIKNYLDNYYKKEFGSPTTFELYTIIAFLYFSTKMIDFLILEVGMGGRLDATNVINPLVCVITPISLDHTRELGDTLDKIAYEKAGIIKKGSIVISSRQNREVEKLLKEKSKKEKTEIHFLKSADYKINFLNMEGCKFSLNNHKNLFLPLLGKHQVENAALAIKVIDILNKKGFQVNEYSIREGLKNVKWLGRLQILEKNPYIVLDGAHNPDSAKVLKKSLKLFNYKKLFLILGMFSDKNIYDFLKEFVRISYKIIISPVGSPRSATPGEVEKYLKNKNKIIKVKNLREGIKIAKFISSKKDLILITGSLYLVGEALNYFSKMRREIEILL